jgi:hypothetical protein
MLIMAGPLPPVAVGLFGLGTGYFVWGGSALAGYPKTKSPEFEKAMGQWGIWMPGFCQFFTGVYLFLGLTIFSAFQASPVLYMAALAFTVYGIHWFSMGWRRYVGADPTPDGFMAIAFLWVSILGAFVFFAAGDIPVAIVFVLLSLIYGVEIPARLRNPKYSRLVAAFQVINGVWLMYLTFAFTTDFALGYHLPV